MDIYGKWDCTGCNIRKYNTLVEGTGDCASIHVILELYLECAKPQGVLDDYVGKAD